MRFFFSERSLIFFGKKKLNGEGIKRPTRLEALRAGSGVIAMVAVVYKIALMLYGK